MRIEIVAPSPAESRAFTASARQGNVPRQEEALPPAQRQARGDKRAPMVIAHCTEQDTHIIMDIETVAPTKTEADSEASTLGSARRRSSIRQEKPETQLQTKRGSRPSIKFADIETVAPTKTEADSEASTLGSARRRSSIRQEKPETQLQTKRGRRPSIKFARQNAFAWLKRIDATANGIAMARYGVVVAWIGLLQTGVSLGLSIATASGMGAGQAATLLNLVFNVIFTLMYVGFLIAHQMMQQKPAPVYHIGVALCTVGYAVFVVFFIVGCAEVKADTAVVERELYINGSGLFLVGSALLVYATMPKGRGCDRRWCGGEPVHSLFWGSVLFVVGSICFLLDSIREDNDSKQRPLEIAGFLTFFIGRLFFLHGSSTQQCDLLLRDRFNTK